MSTTRQQIVSSLSDKEYRDALVLESITQGIAFQIRAMRNARDWTQADLGRACGKGQSEISRLEDPDYEAYTLKTLMQLAATFDVALTVKFVPFSALADEMCDRARTFDVASHADDVGLRAPAVAR